MVDFGNGGIINYDLRKLDQLICVDITSRNGRISNNKVTWVCGDFYDVQLNIRPDFVLAQFLLHHLVEEERLFEAMQRIRSMLKPEGKVIVLEIEVSRFFELVQRIFQPIILIGLAIIGRPPIRFFSAASLMKLLERADFKQIRSSKIPIGKNLSPAPVLFPNLRIPGKIYPFRCIMVEASS